jgi:hypothetical protein
VIAPVDVIAGLLALVRQAAREGAADALAGHATPSPSITPLVDRRETARALGVSPATVTRLTAEGMPCTHVGDAGRYSLSEVRAWLDARGRQATKAAPSKRETVPGVRLLSRAAVGGTR